MTTCPNCGHCLKAAKPKKAKIAHTTGEPAPDRGDGWWRYTNPDGAQFCATVHITDREWAADARKRAKMAERYGTGGRNAALLAIGVPSVREQTEAYLRNARALNARMAAADKRRAQGALQSQRKAA